MLKISARQFRSLDDACDEKCVQRLTALVAKILFDDKIDSAGIDGLAQSVELARVRAAEIGLWRAEDVSIFAALSAVFSRMQPTDAALFREHVGLALRREQSPGNVRLALALRALRSLAFDHPFAAQAMQKIDLVRAEFQ